ncbi:MAG: hypothetical protein ACLFQB_08300 [Chitinispirillaceae bacterium]
MKKHLFSCLIVLVVTAGNSFAQVTVEEDVVTEEVNLFDTVPQSDKSIALAMTASAALPGLGHHYLDESSSAFKYLVFDIAALFGAVLFHSYAVQRESEASAYASTVAGIENPQNNEAYWRHVGSFMEAGDYNEAVDLERSTNEKYLNHKEWWKWGDESQQEEFNELRKQSRHLKVVSSFFLGGMVLNRIVSMVDLKITQKESGLKSLEFQQSVAPDLSGAGVSLTTTF